MTNGEKIEEIFSNIEINPNPYSPSVDIYVGGIVMMQIDRNWWNAEYKELTTKNDSADPISREDALMCLTGEFEDKQYEPSELVSIFSKRIKHLPSVTPQEPIKKLEDQIKQLQNRCHALTHGYMCVFCPYECEHKAEVEPQKSEDT